MLAKERAKARNLRKQGLSVREIAAKINCAKGSVSGWVRDITLTDKQIERLKSNQDNGRANAANHPNSPKQVWARIHNSIIESAETEIPYRYSPSSLKIVGSALYWAEGYKATQNTVTFSNSDPGMIALMMKFFREICNVVETKFHGAVHMHPLQSKIKGWIRGLENWNNVRAVGAIG